MSEDRPVYVACASGSQLMTDLMIRRYGSLIEIVGHPIMHLTPQDAVSAALAILEVANAIKGVKKRRDDDTDHEEDGL